MAASILICKIHPDITYDADNEECSKCQEEKWELVRQATEWRVAPKPEPTPLFDEWKKCPWCESYDTELRVALLDYKEPPEITLYFHCPKCGHESEHRTALFD